MTTDRFGNPFAEALPYARGAILSSTEDDFRKQAGRIIQRRIGRVFNFTALHYPAAHR